MPAPVMPPGFVPHVSAYGLDEPGGVMRTEVAGGFSRYGLDFDRGPQRFRCTFALNKLQFSVWTAFYHHVIRKGALTFSMRLDSGFGTESHDCNIMPGSYSATRTNGTVMVVNFVVEAENKVYDMDAADGAALVELFGEYGEDSNALLAALAQFATVDSLVLDF